MTATRPPAGYPAPRATVDDLPPVPPGPAPGSTPALRFQVTVEDLETGERLAAAQEPVDPEETVDAAARRFAGEVWRLASGLADRGIPLDPHRPIDIAPVDTALAAIDAAHADGYARAVAALRDDERYRDWWTALPPDHPERGYWHAGRLHLADYLEAINRPLPTTDERTPTR